MHKNTILSLINTIHNRILFANLCNLKIIVKKCVFIYNYEKSTSIINIEELGFTRFSMVLISFNLYV